MNVPLSYTRGSAPPLKKCTRLFSCTICQLSDVIVGAGVIVGVRSVSVSVPLYILPLPHENTVVVPTKSVNSKTCLMLLPVPPDVVT